MTEGSDPPDGFRWRNRRRMVWLVVLFCLVAIGFIIWEGGDDTTRTTALSSLSLLLTGVVSSYVFGAVWDDKGK